MFRCQDCRKPIGPRVSPVLLAVGMRSMTYQNVSPETQETVTTHGWEISKEIKLCRTCAMMEPLTPPIKLDVETALAGAVGREEHARRCKKPFDDCKLCKDNLRWFNSLPLLTLARVLADKGSKKGH